MASRIWLKIELRSGETRHGLTDGFGSTFGLGGRDIQVGASAQQLWPAGRRDRLTFRPQRARRPATARAQIRRAG